MMNTTQLIVSREGNSEVFDWLENIGYTNAQRLSAENYMFPVIIVDTEKRTFFGTNTTCMAASVSCGNRPIVLDFGQLKEILPIK